MEIPQPFNIVNTRRLKFTIEVNCLQQLYASNAREGHRGSKSNHNRDFIKIGVNLKRIKQVDSSASNRSLIVIVIAGIKFDVSYDRLK